MLLAYCYDNGIGVSCDHDIASAYYIRAGVSGNADDSYKHRLGGNAMARSVAEKIYKEII